MTTVTSARALATMPADEVDRWFATEHPERIVALVAALSDKDLDRLVALPHLREPAVRHVLGRLPEFALPGPLAKVSGLVEFAIEVPRADPERHALRFGDGTVSRVPVGEQPADVIVGLAAADFVRLVTGTRNAALLLLADRLRVRGDEMLALRVGGLFQVPGRPGVAVDPAEVDPEAAALVLRRAKDAHLRRLMEGGFRDVVLQQIFERLPEFLDGEQAVGHSLDVGFTVTGRPDGTADRRAVRVHDGTCTVEEASGGESGRDAVVTAHGADFLKLVTGNLNPVLGVVRGALKVRGDVTAALTLHRIMRVPGS